MRAIERFPKQILSDQTFGNLTPATRARQPLLRGLASATKSILPPAPTTPGRMILRRPLRTARPRR
jgi:hypothetical protein